MYIALEGIKGVGKSTLLAHLRDWLDRANIDYQLLSPTKPMPAHLWWEELATIARFEQDDQFRQALYAARSNYHAAQINFERGLVLGDRSILTSMVTRWDQTQRLGISPRHYVDYVRRIEWVIPLPDHVILLDVSDEVLLPRLAARQRHYGKQDECLERLHAARAAYHALEEHADCLGLSSIRWHHLDGNRNLHELVDCIGQRIVLMLAQQYQPDISTRLYS